MVLINKIAWCWKKIMAFRYFIFVIFWYEKNTGLFCEFGKNESFLNDLGDFIKGVIPCDFKVSFLFGVLQAVCA